MVAIDLQAPFELSLDLASLCSSSLLEQGRSQESLSLVLQSDVRHGHSILPSGISEITSIISVYSLNLRIQVSSFPNAFWGMVDINGDNASRVFSVSSDVVAKQESIASSNLTVSDAAWPDNHATIELISCRAETIEPNHTDVTIESGQGRTAGPLPLDDD
jgi:hypothetical protein